MDFGFRSKTLVICFLEESHHVRFETALPDPLVFEKNGLEFNVVVEERHAVHTHQLVVRRGRGGAAQRRRRR